MITFRAWLDLKELYCECSWSTWKAKSKTIIVYPPCGAVSHYASSFICKFFSPNTGMVNLFKCLDNRRVRTSALHNCFDKHTIRQIAIRDELNYNQQFPARCCAIQMLRQCISEFADEVSHWLLFKSSFSQWLKFVYLGLLSYLEPGCISRLRSNHNETNKSSRCTLQRRFYHGGLV